MKSKTLEDAYQEGFAYGQKITRKIYNDALSETNKYFDKLKRCGNCNKYPSCSSLPLRTKACSDWEIVE